MKVRIVDSENEKTIMVFDIEDELYDDIKKMAEKANLPVGDYVSKTFTEEMAAEL